LARSFSSVKSTASGSRGTADAVLRALTIVTSRGGGRQAVVVGITSERSDADTKTGIASRLVGGRTSIQITASSIAGTSQAASVGLAIVSSSSNAVDVVGAPSADTSSGVTNGLVSYFSSI
jgi:hypothetical protein